MDEHECRECGDTYHLRPGCEPTPYCDGCAHAILARIAGIIESVDAEERYDNSPSGRHCLKHDLAEIYRLAKGTE